MANTRSGGVPRDSSVSAAISSTARRETRSSSAASTTNLRRSARETKGKKKSDLTTTPSPSATPSQRSTRVNRDTPVSSAKKPQEDSTPSTRKSTRVKATNVSPSLASKQDSTAPVPPDNPAAKRKKDNHVDPQSAASLSKKEKRLNTKTYIGFFKTPEEQAKSPPVLASPHIENGENASGVQVEDSSANLVYVQNNAHELANQEPSSVAANKIREGHSSDLHELPDAVLDRDELKTGCLQSEVISESHVPIEICSLNKVAEGIPMMEAGEQTDGYSNQNSLPELLNGPGSTSHHKASKTIGDGDSIGTHGACTSRQNEAVQSDETDHSDHMCVRCRSRSISDILKSCDGKGCKQHYHLSCIDPPLECVSPGIWLCVTCTKKRIQFGVYSVSEGIDSLWDIKDGPQSSKQYFVKYKNLAHAHNRWVSESDLVDSTPQGRDLISKFIKKIHKEKTIRWKQEWAEPHRLLKKRSLMPPKEAEEFFDSLGDKFAFCNAEWLVKWKDLGYEHATWELETSPFLCTPEAEELKRSYERRREASRRALACGKLNKVKEGVFQKLQRLPDGCPPGLDDDHLSSINKLREFWHSSRGAIFIDDQERVIKTILFVMSILPDVCQPLLIVSTSTSLSVWEAKFNRLAASINVVVYNGETNVRKSIQDLEFYDNGSMMLQVLLSHPDAILEDADAMEKISWEAVLIDDCQSSRVSKCLGQLKRLPTNFRMVLLSSPIKENISEYINLLSFLNTEENILSDSNGYSGDTAGTLSALKAKLAHYIAFERKADSSLFSEYWVPARLSQVQVEMYCYTLLSNSPALRSHSKTDSVGALRNILASLRKCCDHPYLVDQSLQNSLTKGHPITDILDIGVHSCGKLLLLDKMLQELRTEGLRVLILCQSGGGSGNPMGDILDDFVRQRFGYESYERVERGLLVQKKQIAMSMFNDKKKGRFIFLMDSRACVPSIKLSSVDAVIIYSSDWNPVNDLRALQRISIESKSEHVPIFRLYSSCTVEEKALILAKHDQILDNNIQNITPSLNHGLLSWGASFLFDRLDKFQNLNYSSKGSDDDKLFTDNVLSEFSTKLSTKVEFNTKRNNAVISQAHLCGSFYSRDIVVIGEREGISSPDGDLPKFWAYWSNLLHGRSPQWQHISEPAQRSRRKIQNMEEPLVNIEEQSKVAAEETDEARMKRRKIGEIMDSSSIVPPHENKDTLLSQNNTPSSSHQMSVDDTWQELETNNLHGAQRGLHVQLKPELSKLYQLLELPESVKSLCEELLEYILKNHQVSQEPKGILHAFNIALCWRAASLLKHKVNRSESLALAVKSLKYECSERLVLFVYEKLRILKKKFARRAGEINMQSQSISSSNLSPLEQETSTKMRNDESTLSQAISVGDSENGLHLEAPRDNGTKEIVSGEKELLCDTETHRGKHLSRDELLNRIVDKRIQLVDKVFSLREKSIQDKHSKEVSLLDTHRQREIAKLRGACTLVVKHLRKSHIDQEDMVGKVNLIIEWFTMLLYAFLDHMRCQRSKLDMQQSAAWTKESQLKEQFFQAAKSGQLDHAFDQQIPLPDLDFAVEEFSHFREEIGSCHVHAASLTTQSLDDDSAMEITLVRSVNASEVSTAEGERNGHSEVLIQRSPSEVVSLTVNRIHDNISDGNDLQGDTTLAVQHSVVNNSLIDSLANQESSGGDQRSAGNVEEERTSISLLQSGASQHLGDAVMEGNIENNEASVIPHLHIPGSIAMSSQATLPMSREVEAQRNTVTQSEQQSLPSLAPSQCPQGEPGQEGLSSVVSAQPLQSARQPSNPVSNNPSETAQPDQSQPSRTYAPPDSGQPTLFPVASMMFNHPPIDDEPLKNEMHKLRLHMDTINKIHEMKKSQLRMGCNQEIEKVKRKYDLLIQEHDSTHIQQKKTLDDVYEKVLRNQSLAEDFRAKFISPSATQARTHSPQARQTPQVSQQAPTRPSLPGTSASPVASSPAYQPPITRPLLAGSSASPVESSSACRPPIPRSRVQLPQVERSSSSLSQVSRPSLPSSQVSQPAPSIPGNHFRATSAPIGHLPTPHGSYGAQGELAPRAPAPHLQFRPPRSHSMPPGDQQQLPRPEMTSSSSRTELSSVAQGTSPLSSSQPTVLENPSTTDSHQDPLATSAMPNLHSALPATSPSSSHPVLPASLLAPGSSQSHLTQHIQPNPNLPILNMMMPCTTAAASSATPAGRHIGPFMQAGVQATDAGSLSLDAWLTAKIGLSSGSPRVGAPANDVIDVVCLSDDD